MDADGEQDVARDGQLAQRLALDADEGVRGDVAVGELRRAVGGAVDALDVGERMVERVAGLDRPVEALAPAARPAGCRTCGRSMSAVRVPGPKPGTGSWISCSGLPNFSVSDQDEGKHSEPAASRQPLSPRRIRIRSSWTSSEAATQRRVGKARRQRRCVPRRRRPRCPRRCGDGCAGIAPADSAPSRSSTSRWASRVPSSSTKTRSGISA